MKLLRYSSGLVLLGILILAGCGETVSPLEVERFIQEEVVYDRPEAIRNSVQEIGTFPWDHGKILVYVIDSGRPPADATHETKMIGFTTVDEENNNIVLSNEGRGKKKPEHVDTMVYSIGRPNARAGREIMTVTGIVGDPSVEQVELVFANAQQETITPISGTFAFAKTNHIPLCSITLYDNQNNIVYAEHDILSRDPTECDHLEAR